MKEHINYVLLGFAFFLLVFLILLIVVGVKLHNRNAEIDELYDEFGIDEAPAPAPKKNVQVTSRGKSRQPESKRKYQDTYEDDDEFEEYEEDDYEDEFAEYDDDAYEDGEYDDEYDDEYEDEYEDDEEADEDDDLVFDGLLHGSPTYRSGKKKKDRDGFSMDFIDLE